jgi:hypothetical protein
MVFAFRVMVVVAVQRLRAQRAGAARPARHARHRGAGSVVVRGALCQRPGRAATVPRHRRAWEAGARPALGAPAAAGVKPNRP